MPVVVELTHFADGKWRTGTHLSVTSPDAFRSVVLGLMTTHSPKLFQAVFIDAHDHRGGGHRPVIHRLPE